MTSPPEARRAKRILWLMVLGILALNAVLFLLTSRREPKAPTPPATGTTNVISEGER